MSSLKNSAMRMFSRMLQELQPGAAEALIAVVVNQAFLDSRKLLICALRSNVIFFFSRLVLAASLVFSL